MLHRILNLVGKELIQFRRDRVLAAFVVLVPMLQLTLLAQATSKGITNQPVVVVDLDHSPISRELVVALDTTEALHVQFQIDDLDTMNELLDAGQVRVAVILPAGLARDLDRAGSPPRIRIITDATNTVAAAFSLSSAVAAINQFSAGLAAGHGLVVAEAIDFRTQARFNPTLDSRIYTIPAQIGFIIYQVTLAVASLGLARERELGTLEQLMVTPVRRLELTTGKALPAVAVGLLNFATLLVLGLVLFGVPLYGSPLVLGGLTVLFVVALANWGVVLSSIAQTQQQAILFVFIQAMVDISLSGYLVSVQNMPWLLRTLSNISPLRHYLKIIRSVMLKGAGLDTLWPEALALALLGLVTGALALRSIMRRLD